MDVTCVLSGELPPSAFCHSSSSTSNGTVVKFPMNSPTEEFADLQYPLLVLTSARAKLSSGRTRFYASGLVHSSGDQMLAENGCINESQNHCEVRSLRRTCFSLASLLLKGKPFSSRKPPVTRFGKPGVTLSSVLTDSWLAVVAIYLKRLGFSLILPKIPTCINHIRSLTQPIPMWLLYEEPVPGGRKINIAVRCFVAKKKYDL